MADRRPVRFLDLLRHLVDAKVDFVVVGGVAAVLEGAPISTFDVDVLYSIEPANVDRLAGALVALEAEYVDPAGRRIAPSAKRLRSGGHHLMRTRLGRLDVLSFVGDGLGYEDLVPSTNLRELHGLKLRVLSLEALIATKERANRPKDRAVLELLRATLAEREASASD